MTPNHIKMSFLAGRKRSLNNGPVSTGMF